MDKFRENTLKFIKNEIENKYDFIHSLNGISDLTLDDYITLDFIIHSIPNVTKNQLLNLNLLLKSKIEELKDRITIINNIKTKISPETTNEGMLNEINNLIKLLNIENSNDISDKIIEIIRDDIYE